jgi:hypothetical protein
MRWYLSLSVIVGMFCVSGTHTSDAPLKDLKTLVLRGSWQQLDAGSGRLMPAKPYEIRVIVPDHYLRLASTVFARLRSGFAGDRLIYEWKAQGPQVKMAMRVPDDQIKTERAQYTRLMQGMLPETQTVRYQDLVSFPVAGGAASGSMPPPESVEVTLTFEDRRMVDGFSLPFRIRQTARDVTFQDIRFETILVNPPLTAAEFEADESRPQ